MVHAFSCTYIEFWMHLGSSERVTHSASLVRVYPKLDIRTIYDLHQACLQLEMKTHLIIFFS